MASSVPFSDPHTEQNVLHEMVLALVNSLPPSFGNTFTVHRCDKTSSGVFLDFNSKERGLPGLLNTTKVPNISVATFVATNYDI
jgi:hypothetical protein